MNTNRQLNIELLRGVLMLMICGLHVIGVNILDCNNPISTSSYNFYISNFFESAFVMAVDCFVLISGYFGIRANLRKYILFILPIIFYTFIIYLGKIVITGNFSIIELIFNLFPVISNQYWFVTVYACLFILSPVLNIIINNLSERQYDYLLMIGSLFFIIIPTFSPFSFTNHDRGFGIINFCMLYLWGHYLKEKTSADKSKRNLFIFTYLIAVLFIFLGNIVQGQLSINHGGGGWRTHCNAYNNLIVYIAAISFFQIFRTIRCNRKIIGYLSPSFFFVYIIHENNNLRYPIYQFLHCEDFYYSPWWIVHMLISMVLIFTVCIAIDLIRRKILENYITDLADKLSTIINNYIFTPVLNFIYKSKNV